MGMLDMMAAASYHDWVFRSCFVSFHIFICMK
jgi:hypothetical protein